jgi:lactoylglutathione lyase
VGTVPGGRSLPRRACAALTEENMAYRINHIHLKASDPRQTADWYVRAFGFKILSDDVRVFGDRFVRCLSQDGGMAVNISGARTGERLGPGDAMPHHGLEHFGFDSDHLETDIKRLEGLGATLLEGPIQVPNGPRIRFLRAPDDTRIELIEPRPQSGGAC